MNIDEFDAAFFSKDDVYGCVGLCKKQGQTLTFVVFSLIVTDNELLSIVSVSAKDKEYFLYRIALDRCLTSPATSLKCLSGVKITAS